MVNPIPRPKLFSQRSALGRRLTAALLGITTLVTTVTASAAAWAGDPFRAQNPSPTIGDRTEAAFYSMFRDGDYRTARTILAADENSTDPLHHALLGALAYLDQDWNGLLRHAQATQRTAAALVRNNQDPLRGHLYEAVGIFLEGGHHIQTVGIARGTPRALAMLNQVFARLDRAEAINPRDPELNLIKGYMDLLLAVNLPFADPAGAIANLRANAAPNYLVLRGIAIAQRDIAITHRNSQRNAEALQTAEQALQAAEQALQAIDAAVPGVSNTNPEILYLKGQILALMGRPAEASQQMAAALTFRDQLPPGVVTQLRWEYCALPGADRAMCTP